MYMIGEFLEDRLIAAGGRANNGAKVIQSLLDSGLIPKAASELVSAQTACKG
jgi:hypothetical protein